MRVNVAQSSLSPPSLYHHNSLHLHRTQSFLKLSPPKSTIHILPRSCSASFNGYEDFNYPVDDFNTHNKKHQQHNLPTTTTSFRCPEYQVELLEPSSLGIRPEPPNWPARDEVIRECFARRVSSIELPLSLRIIKMKKRFQRLEEERILGNYLEKNMNNNNNNPISNLCCSTLFIIKEVQSQSLKIKGLVLDKDLDGIWSNVQKHMTYSFAWLFTEVFAKTPDLMLEVTVLASNFATYSLETYQLQENPKLDRNLSNFGIGDLELGKCGVPTREIFEEKELELWNSIVEEANEMKGGVDGLEFVVDHDHDDDHDDHHDVMKQKFVSPVRVEIEDDDYEEYYRTDLLYQIGLSHDPNNTLLLFNYAQFLHLVSRDYDRAEECFKRAIQLDPTDAGVISHYASFLWIVRKDTWGAEEWFQQAVAAEPGNNYHASKYATFLWRTGGEDTCYPLDPPRTKV